MMVDMSGAAVFVAVVLAVVAFSRLLRVISQYERGVVLTLGRYSGTREPGLTVVVPLLQTLLRVDIRTMVMEIDPQDVITSDNVSVKVAAVTYYRVIEPSKAVLDVRQYRDAIDQLAQIALRAVIGRNSLDRLLAQQDELNDEISRVLDRRTTEWGVQVTHVEIRSVDLAPSMVRAMAQEAEAERGRRARVITAAGEYEAATKLAEAAEILGRHPAALTLRSLATMKEIGAEQATIIVWPITGEAFNPSAAAISEALRQHPPGK